MVVYVDLLLAVNWLMNLVLIILAGWLSLQPLKIPRYCVAAAIGTGVYFIFFMFNQYILIEWICRLAGALLMARVAYSSRGIGLTMARALSLLVVGQLAGGVVFSFLYLNQGIPLTPDNDTVSVVWLLATAGFLLAAAAYLTQWVQSFGRMKNYLGDAEIRFGARRVRARALMDSGNSLQHPVTGWPVILAEREIVSKLFPEGIAWADNPHQSPPSALFERVALIPYRSVGGTGMLAGFRPDEVHLSLSQHSKVLTRIYVVIRPQTTKRLAYPVIAFPINNREEGEILEEIMD